MKRRQFLRLAPVTFGLVWVGTMGYAKSMEKAIAGMTQIRVYSVETQDFIRVDIVDRSEEEWRRPLTPEQFRVLREQGTERAFTGKYHDSKEPGVYRCAACGQDLYLSETKYDSHSGWPSFYQPVAAENVRTREDRSFFMTRNELVCSRCESHLGHVFDDGPKPSGKRHCINSVSLTFAKR